MVDFTHDEKALLIQVLVNTPVQGTLQTLPKTLDLMMSILKKLEYEHEAPSNLVDVPGPDPGDILS